MKYESTAKISIETLNDLIAENCIYEITIQDPKNYPKGKTYDLFALLSVKRAIAEFLKGCPERNSNDPNTEKQIFAYIYTKLAYWATYDDLAREINHANPTFKELYATDYLHSASGLEGVMIGKSGICSGFAETLRNLLAEKGIEAKYVTGWCKDYNGTGQRVGHAWNQVKLDGEWFNCDITSDRNFIIQDLNAPMFLKSSSEFSNYYRYPECTNVNVERAQRSISRESQNILINRCRSRVIDELFPKPEQNKSKKKGFIELISQKLKSLRNTQRGDD